MTTTPTPQPAQSSASAFIHLCEGNTRVAAHVFDTGLKGGWVDLFGGCAVSVDTAALAFELSGAFEKLGQLLVAKSERERAERIAAETGGNHDA